MGVHLRGGDAPVTEKSLYVSDVDAFFEQVRGDRVPEHVRCDSPRHTSALGEFPDLSANVLRGRTTTSLIRQKGVARWNGRAPRLAVPSQSTFQLVRHKHTSFAIALS